MWGKRIRQLFVAGLFGDVDPMLCMEHLRDVEGPDLPDDFPMRLIVADYCVDSAMRLLTEDLRWVPAGEVQEGDRLIGFDEKLSRAKLKSSVVEGCKRVTKPRFKVTMDNGAELICSGDHQWVVGGSGETWKRRRRSWVRTDELELGDRIGFFAEPWDTAQGWDAGYLSGILDGEGRATRSGKVSMAQRPNACLRQIESSLTKFPELEVRRRLRKKDDVQQLDFYGNKGGLRAIGVFRPARLLEKAHILWDGKRTWSAHTPVVRVTKIERLEDGEVVAIQTSTKTFICEGFLSHNCQLEMRIMAHFSCDQGMIDAINKGLDLHCQTVVLASERGVPGIPAGLTYDEVKAAKAAANPTPEQALLAAKRGELKSTGFGIIYGIGALKLGMQLGLPIVKRTFKNGKSSDWCPEADKLIKNYLNDIYPAVGEFIEDTKHQCRQELAVYTLIGHPRRLPDIVSSERGLMKQAERQAPNARIQGSAADITNEAMLRCEADEELRELGVRMLLQVHDELIFEVPDDDDYAIPAKRRITELMENPFPMRVPVEIDIEEGDNWGDAKG